jgi:hypothetical protein
MSSNRAMIINFFMVNILINCERWCQGHWQGITLAD